MESALAEIDSVAGAKDLLDKAATMRHYAERLKAGVEVERPIALGVLKIKAKLGELMPAEKGGRGKKGVKQLNGFTKPTISAYRKLAANKERLEEFYEGTEDVLNRAAELSGIPATSSWARGVLFTLAERIEEVVPYCDERGADLDAFLRTAIDRQLNRKTL